MSDFIVIAHRGASGSWPENSLLAFAKALEAGVSWLELDIHRSADGELVVIHDSTLQRTSNGRGTVSSMSLKELQRFDIGQGEKVPLLAKVLDLAAGKATVNIELKGAGVAIPLAKLLRQRIDGQQQSAGNFLASSLNEKELILFAEQLPQVRVAPVSDCPDLHTWQLANRLNAWSVHLEKGAVDQQVISEARRHKRKLLAYTVNAPDEVERLKVLGIDGVFSDYPERLLGEHEKSFHGR